MSNVRQTDECGIRICKEGERALDSFAADGLVIFGEGYGDPGRSGLVERFGMPEDHGFFYVLGPDAPFRYAVYCCGEYQKPWIPVEELLARGARSIVIDYSPEIRRCFGDSIPRLLLEHGISLDCAVCKNED